MLKTIYDKTMYFIVNNMLAISIALILALNISTAISLHQLHKNNASNSIKISQLSKKIELQSQAQYIYALQLDKSLSTLDDNMTKIDSELKNYNKLLNKEIKLNNKILQELIVIRGE